MFIRQLRGSIAIFRLMKIILNKMIFVGEVDFKLARLLLVNV
jgi:hypothetical protein